MNRNGFTVVEVLIVVAIIAIVLGAAGAFSVLGVSQNQLDDISIQARNILRRAEWQSLNGERDDQWSVHFETSKFVLFKGVTYSAVDPDNVETTFPPSIEIATISLNGGGSDVIFSDEFGNTSTYGTITFQNTASLVTREIEINQAGMIDLD